MGNKCKLQNTRQDPFCMKNKGLIHGSRHVSFLVTMKIENVISDRANKLESTIINFDWFLGISDKFFVLII